MEKEKIKRVINEIETYHNHSLYKEIYERNLNNLDNEAIYYRGTSITYRKLFENTEKYVKSFQSMGISEGDEIPVCIANTPELIYLLMAASYAGVKINIFGAEFDDDYKKSIINKCNSNYIFISDDMYPKIKESIDKSNVKKIIMFSLVDSLKNNIDPYYEIDKKFYDFSNKVVKYKENNNTIISQSEFISLGEEEVLKPCVKGNLDFQFTTTYSSGSTNSTKPKGIVHMDRSYIIMGRSHDTDLSNAPSMHGLRVLAMIPTHSNTNIMSNITDTLIQGSCVAPEPIGNPKFLLNSLLINKPNFVTATRSLILYAAKQILFDKKYSRVKLPYLFALFSVGEPTSGSEEKFMNKALKKAGAGKLQFSRVENKFYGKLPISFPVSIAGGDCEHGGIFYTMFKSWSEAKERFFGRLSKNENMGMNTHQIVDCIVMDEQGNILPNGVVGRLYATSPCNMFGYRDNDEATKLFFKNINGEIYGDCSVLAYKDNYGRIHVKGRIDKNLPMYVNRLVTEISDVILKDTKNILSCEVIPQLVNDEYCYIAHIEFMPISEQNISKKLLDVENRCNNLLSNSITKNIYYRVRGFNESFPLTGCGKRNNIKLKDEGITKSCVKPIEEENGIVIRDFFSYNNLDNNVIKK